ncbi:endonuclease domain-containing protein [Zeaxanthinibacter enoshimensis]|uniref:Very-short-patch-repair endonuclease n=1 Tax=Zeaxanthinibacter enoshimensis TaxID=392009 RepID=A0A4R6TRA7_9FLAO|nr:endonuclease domain-containing protein [Zeaxanthinibacter enoshimensis]TDQ32673.1 very-short-patch-repair endonuclease [Zeaxanthinibacter enoshimensis]
MKNKIIPYNPELRRYAQELRKNSTLSEVLLWDHIKKKALGVEFHRQVPLLHFIVDFYCHELQLVVEIDGDSHLHKYEYDVRRQGNLEKLGLSFIRFTDHQVKQELFSVIIDLEERIQVPRSSPETIRLSETIIPMPIIHLCKEANLPINFMNPA